MSALCLKDVAAEHCPLYNSGVLMSFGKFVSESIGFSSLKGFRIHKSALS